MAVSDYFSRIELFKSRLGLLARLFSAASTGQRRALT